ncbi:hypothetical protein Xsto_01567 [Xenorhabdus stockiae]|uniref:Uncharacterized protein n=1 Tax=Xenorhabdus stockiae TaxID=351614 RepID=A0A2D0KRJ8_9GAMM|nr:hypothetical protein Xsto_01567 [Xenorhabdus stockiae]
MRELHHFCLCPYRKLFASVMMARQFEVEKENEKEPG